MTTAATDPVLNVLIAARALLAKGWCQDVIAEDDRHMECPSRDARAYRWSLTGAITAVLPLPMTTDVFVELYMQINAHLAVAAKQLGEEWTTGEEFNNELSRTQSKVLAVMDAAIDSRRKRGS